MNHSELMAPFHDPDAAARYAENPPRFVPGLFDLHRMAAILLAEQAPHDGHLLVLGAGGGMELRAFAEAQPAWRFTGVDPSAEMLAVAAQMLGPNAQRADLLQGYIEDAPEGPFDGGACLLTLHFLPEPERLRVLREIHSRLRPGAALVTAHLCVPQGVGGRARWLSRYAEFAVSAGMEPANAQQARSAVDAHLNILTPEQDEALLWEAGFSSIEAFYVGFAFRGWVALA
ncbi:class I SAM-dependent methyltransferase [Pseudomonas nitroreducens]|uniref:Methyltransferase n=1 Tax=Pseudomonas nitroreducens TaxID=46680 RepID=A0A246FBM7_PSENT|nr:class I SAM-dependent methyltransferase [Pseudomonas nitroreducens]OWP50850.1 methyltransferase [Pseudomonas nitroreducens]